MAVAGSQTSKNSSSLAAEDDSALSGLEGGGLFCLTLELAAIDELVEEQPAPGFVRLC